MPAAGTQARIIDNVSAHRERPLHFLMSVIGGYGHFHPLVPLARGLQRAGHEVAFATGASLRPLVEAGGFTWLAVGGNLASDQEYQAFKVERQGMPLSLESELVIYTRLFAGISTRLRTPQLVAAAREWQADMLIREAGEYGAAIAAEHLGLPHASVSFAASARGLMRFERDVAAQLDRIRAEWGLPPDPTLAALYRHLFLVYAPPSFSAHAIGEQEDTRLLPRTARFLRPEVFDQADGAGLPEWVAHLPEGPTVYATLGTEANSEPGIYPDVLQTIIAGLRDAPFNLIVTLGRDRDPTDFGPQPPNMHIERYIPQSLLLPSCDLVVMHGGSNTLLAALDIGLPLVVVPLIADQFFNARVVEAMGLGRVVPREQLSPARIRAAVDDVLANPLYRRDVARVRDEMHALPDQTAAVGLVAGIATGGSLPTA